MTTFCTMRKTFTHPTTVDFIQEFTCSECGGSTFIQLLKEEDTAKYCSQCGAKVVLSPEDRVQMLEELCRDMYKALDNIGCTVKLLSKFPKVDITGESAEKTRRDIDCYKVRMEALGLLEGEQ